jgi:hypothetical protein
MSYIFPSTHSSILGFHELVHFINKPTYSLVSIIYYQFPFVLIFRFTNEFISYNEKCSVYFFLLVVCSAWNKVKGILSTSCVIFSYPKLLSISVLTFIKLRLNIELLMNTLRNVVFSTKKADHCYRKLINYALTWARPTLFIYLFLCQ